MTKWMFLTGAVVALSACQGEKAEETNVETSMMSETSGTSAEETTEPDTAAPMESTTSDAALSDIVEAASQPEKAVPASDTKVAAQMSAKPPVAVASTASRPKAVERGAQIFAQSCVACHGQGGKGNVPGVPDLTAPGGRLTKSDAVLLQNMKNGFQSPGSPMAMPARGGNANLTDQDMAAALAYIRAEFGR